MNRVGILAALFGLLGGLPAHAQGPAYCYGTVRYTLTAADGVVLVMPSFRNDWIQVCNTTTTWNGVSGSICNIWVAYLTTAAASQKQVIIAYSSLSSCGGMSTYGSAPAPTYISISGES